MSCLGPVSAGRTPAVVRLTASACVPSLLRLLPVRSTDKCLHDATRPTGSGASYMVASRRTPQGVLLRPNSACGVASRCCHPTWPVSSRPPCLHSWSRMLLTIKARGPLAPRPYRKLSQYTTAGPLVPATMPPSGWCVLLLVPARR
jgi:hypothetical protein